MVGSRRRGKAAVVEVEVGVEVALCGCIKRTTARVCHDGCGGGLPVVERRRRKGPGGLHVNGRTNLLLSLLRFLHLAGAVSGRIFEA